MAPWMSCLIPPPGLEAQFLGGPSIRDGRQRRKKKEPRALGTVLLLALSPKRPPIPKNMGPQPTALYHIGSYMQKNIQKHQKTHQIYGGNKNCFLPITPPYRCSADRQHEFEPSKGMLGRTAAIKSRLNPRHGTMQYPVTEAVRALGRDRGGHPDLLAG